MSDGNEIGEPDPVNDYQGVITMPRLTAKLATAAIVAMMVIAGTPWVGSAETACDVWKGGAASVVITPTQPTWMAGYGGRNKPSEGKFQDLFAKALVLEDYRGARLVIVTLDLISVPRPLREYVARHLEEQHRIGSSHLLMNCSHTHSGPLARITKSVIYQLAPEQMKAVEENLNVLQKKLVDVVDAAIKDLAPARLGYCHARAGFAMNRRLPSETGFRNSPNPEGPIDHDVPVLRVERPDGKLRAVLFGYACHNTTLGLYQFCGDYAGYAQEYLEADHPGAVALFMIGCGADQNPYPRGKLEQAQQHGRTLANAVETALMPKARPVRGPLQAAFEDLPLGFVDVPSPEELQVQAQSKDRYQKRHAELLLEELRDTGKLRDSYPYPVQVIQFDRDLRIVTLGGEVVVEYSLRLKRELSEMPLWVAGYSHDVFAYIPSARVAMEGGYEGGAATILTTLPGPFAPAIEEQVVRKVHELVQKVQRE
jgi:hypothetical protein